jgi:hypothetical protein
MRLNTLVFRYRNWLEIREVERLIRAREQLGYDTEELDNKLTTLLSMRGTEYSKNKWLQDERASAHPNAELLEQAKAHIRIEEDHREAELNRALDADMREHFRKR